ncbi:MAG: 4-hydroxy-tetrahydrodipicolinate synthase [Rectinemataceae bacterium]
MAAASATFAIGGLGVALATPFDEAGRVDFAGFAGLVDFVSAESGSGGSFRAAESGGADFLVVLGSTGEGATIEAGERRELVARAVEVSPGLPVVVGAGSNSTAQCVRFVAEAVDLGADGLLVVVPYYNKPTPDGLVAHFRAAAGAARGKPVIVYNVPGRTGLNLTPSVLSRLWEIPGIAAVKESSGNLAQIGEIGRTLPEGKILLSGDDALALPSVALGAEGLISVAANVLPRRCKAMLAAAFAGKRDEALRLHRQLLPFMDALFLESNPVPLKAALALVGLCGEGLRLPLTGASRSTRTRLAETLAAISEGRA